MPQWQRVRHQQALDSYVNMILSKCPRRMRQPAMLKPAVPQPRKELQKGSAVRPYSILRDKVVTRATYELLAQMHTRHSRCVRGTVRRHAPCRMWKPQYPFTFYFPAKFALLPDCYAYIDAKTSGVECARLAASSVFAIVRQFVGALNVSCRRGNLRASPKKTMKRSGLSRFPRDPWSAT